MNKLIVLVMFLFSVPIMADELTFLEAKAKADAVEGNMVPPESHKLLEAQGQVANSAFPKCITSTGGMPSDFTVVVSVDSLGIVNGSWRQGETPFAKCFEQSMRKKLEYIPKVQPFFTSFEYTHKT